MYRGAFTGRCWWYYALGDVPLGISGTRSCGRTDLERYGVSEPYCGSVLVVYDLCLLNWKLEYSKQNKALCHKVRNVFDWFQEHDSEFHLMSWPPNSPHLNQIEHIWSITERQTRVPISPSRNISDLRDCCLNIWYNLSSAIYQGYVASMSRRVSAVLRAKVGTTGY